MIEVIVVYYDGNDTKCARCMTSTPNSTYDGDFIGLPTDLKDCDIQVVITGDLSAFGVIVYGETQTFD